MAGEPSRAERVRIELRPYGRSIEVARGTPLRDVLYMHGVEFPCGGRGRCKRCLVQVVAGELGVTPDDAAILEEAELAEGWRLACRSRANRDVAIHVEQFRAPILADHSAFDFEPRPGFGVAVDLGTTTLVAQLVDLTSGCVLACHTGLNPQGAFGSDIMNRTQHARDEAGRRQLTSLVRRGIGTLVGRVIATAELDDERVDNVTLVGNTVMHHLFCGLDVEPLASVPFESSDDGLQELEAAALGWKIAGDPVVRFLPCLGSFVGSDVLAGVLATRMHESDELMALVDLGTNGEIVVGNAEHMLCASTAAGPAFEAGGIQMGMQATTGAIDQVGVANGGLRCRVVGAGAPRGICGSGLVDAVAAGLDLGWVEPSGRLGSGRERLDLLGPVHITQSDVRQLQLAKGAIAAGIRILLNRWGAGDSVPRVNLAGAFGNYVNRASARRIGLIDFPDESVEPVGNTALLGAKLALFGRDRAACAYPDVLSRIEHLSLASDPSFQEIFVAETRFPA
jgi:uncharacterized 2Fe-2S/4Fe-4S cluster protein (DUF4445 family)